MFLMQLIVFGHTGSYCWYTVYTDGIVQGIKDYHDA